MREKKEDRDVEQAAAVADDDPFAEDAAYMNALRARLLFADPYLGVCSLGVLLVLVVVSGFQVLARELFPPHLRFTRTAFAFQLIGCTYAVIFDKLPLVILDSMRCCTCVPKRAWYCFGGALGGFMVGMMGAMLLLLLFK